MLLGGGFSPQLAYALAIWISLTWNFVPNRYFTFDLSAHHAIGPQYGRFVLTCALGAIINWSITMALPHQVGWFINHTYVAALMGIGAGTIFNFLISHAWAFRSTQLSK